jgi:hypothetical protein
MSQRRHEKVLRRKAKMGRRGKQRREARRQQRIEVRNADLGSVFGSLFTGQVVDTETVNRLNPEERDRMEKIREKFDGVDWKKKVKSGREQGRAARKTDLETVCSSLMAGVAEGGTEEKVRAMKERLNRLYGKAGEAA